MRDKGFRILFIARKPVSTPQSDEVLVAVKFPDDLLVTKQIRVEIIQATPVNDWRAFACDWFQMPVDWSSEAEITKAQKVKGAVCDAVGLLDDLVFSIGPTASQFADSCLRIIK